MADRLAFQSKTIAVDVGIIARGAAQPIIGFSSSGSKAAPPRSLAYSLVLKSLIRTITGLG
jgi:hypothetical protein